MGFIYLRTNKVNGKKYVGQVTTIRFKARQNRWNNLKHSYAGPAINAARAKYGIDNFGFEILKECDDKELDYWEKYYIKELNTKAPYGYNLTDGGDGCKGYHHTEKTKKKIIESNRNRILSEEARRNMSEAQKHKKPISEETRKKMSETRKGMKYSEERNRKISESKMGEKHPLYGKHLSEETRKKMSETRKGEKHWNYGKHWSDEYKRKQIDAQKSSRKIIQININTNEVIAEFPSIREAERQTGFKNAAITNCCKGRTKSSYGYIWKYKESAA